MKPCIYVTNPDYWPMLVRWHGRKFDRIGKLLKVEGFDSYNHLIDLNVVLSPWPFELNRIDPKQFSKDFTEPFGDPVDRTGNIKGPFNFAIQRPWQQPGPSIEFDQVMAKRAKWFIDHNQEINIAWSGGIDSTAVVVAMLHHASNIDQLQILFTNSSVEENADFYQYIHSQWPGLRWLNIEEQWRTFKPQGWIVNGNGGDEFTAALGEFVLDHDHSALAQPWQDFFWSADPRENFMEFCSDFFSRAQRPVENLLHARWWFYASCKPHDFNTRYSQFIPQVRTQGFFECQEFEDWIWHNVDNIIDLSGSWSSYKKFLKDYIYDFYPNHSQRRALKVYSPQFSSLAYKRILFENRSWIAILEDYSTLQTPNLPLFSYQEWLETYGRKLDYLFNYEINSQT